MAISTPDPRRRRRSRSRVKLPRNLGGGRRPQPYSRADAPYFRGPGFYVRIGGLAALVAVALTLLILRAWSIQVLNGAKYSKEVHAQAYRTVNLNGARGAIVDDKNRLLVGTSGRLVVTADAASLGSRDAHGRWHPSAGGLREIRRFAERTHTRPHALVARIKEAVLHVPFAPAIVLTHPSLALSDYLQERVDSFPAFKVEGQVSRSYPLGAFGSEFLGLVGQVTAPELRTRQYGKAQAGQIVGQSGVERAHDSLLDPGFLEARVPVDSMGRIAGSLRIPKQKQPPTLQLSIDTRMQRATEKALQDGMADARSAGYAPTGGSAVVMDPWTGAIKALASDPTFDEKLAATDPRYYQHLLDDTTGDPLLNRAIAGVYPTGSTFKPIIAEAALSAGLINPYTEQLCSGSFDLGGQIFHNVEGGIYEEMTLPTAIEQSCDTWFYRLGDRIWEADPSAEGRLIQQWAKKLGLGSTPPIDLTGAEPGWVPTPGSHFTKVEGFPWTEGQTINLAIGQGALQVSPLQLAVAYSAIVNGGTVVRPHVAEAVIRNGVRHVLPYKPVRKVKLSPYTWAIKQGMYEAANDPAGTSYAVFNGFHPTVAGKTGTAQTTNAGPPDHSWYASFAPYSHPQLVVVVMIQDGGYGADAAAPAAKEIYQAYFHGK